MGAFEAVIGIDTDALDRAVRDEGSGVITLARAHPEMNIAEWILPSEVRKIVAAYRRERHTIAVIQRARENNDARD